MGYSESLKTYRIYIPGSRKIEVRRDVTFQEVMDIYDTQIDDDEEMKSS